MLIAGNALVEILGGIMLVVFLLSLILATIGSAAQQIERAVRDSEGQPEVPPGRFAPKGFRFRR